MAQLVAEGAQRIEGMEVRVRDVEDKRAPVRNAGLWLPLAWFVVARSKPPHPLVCLQDDALWADGIAVGTPTNLGVRWAGWIGLWRRGETCRECSGETSRRRFSRSSVRLRLFSRQECLQTISPLQGISWRMKRFWDDWSADNWSKVRWLQDLLSSRVENLESVWSCQPPHSQCPPRLRSLLPCPLLRSTAKSAVVSPAKAVSFTVA